MFYIQITADVDVSTKLPTICHYCNATKVGNMHIFMGTYFQQNVRNCFMTK